MVCVDGSGLHPKDTLLRTVAWATAWRVGEQWCTHAGPVPGAQSVPRSEACAILAAITAMTHPGVIWSDCLQVTKAVRSVHLHGQLSMQLRKSPMADILQSMVPHLARLGPLIVIRWMRSHGTVESAIADGVPREAWEGNDPADKAAKAEAQRFAPSTSICLERERMQALHLRACRLIAAVAGGAHGGGAEATPTLHSDRQACPPAPA